MEVLEFFATQIFREINSVNSASNVKSLISKPKLYQSQNFHCRHVTVTVGKFKHFSAPQFYVKSILANLESEIYHFENFIGFEI